MQGSRLVVLASGNGSNLQAIIDAVERHQPEGHGADRHGDLGIAILARFTTWRCAE